MGGSCKLPGPGPQGMSLRVVLGRQSHALQFAAEILTLEVPPNVFFLPAHPHHHPQFHSFVNRRKNAGCLHGSLVQGHGVTCGRTWQGCISRRRYSLPWRAVSGSWGGGGRVWSLVTGKMEGRLLMPGTCVMQQAFMEHLLCARIREHSLQGACTHTGIIIQVRFMTDQWEEGTW